MTTLTKEQIEDVQKIAQGMKKLFDSYPTAQQVAENIRKVMQANGSKG